MTAGLRVLFIGKRWEDLDEYTVVVLDHPAQLFRRIAEFKPDVIVTSEYMPTALNVAAFELRKRWIHVDPNSEKAAVVAAIESCYAANIWGPHPLDSQHPLVSVYTPTFNTGDYLLDTYQSLHDQTYPNWEWVVVDDSSDDGTWDKLTMLALEDSRVKPFRAHKQRKIGAMKDLATRLCNGEFLIELDHDDMLVDTAVEKVKNAFMENPDVGMVYTNCACIFGDNSPQMYTDDFWKPRYREVEYRGKKYMEAINPNIYDRFGPEYWQQFGWYLTVGPNHIRAYRRKTLFELGGYNRNLPVADDWDVFARFFLYSKCLHINEMLYIYRFHDAFANTTFTANKSIQDHLELGRRHYAKEFERFNSERLKHERKETEFDQKNVSVLIPDWDGREDTEQCIESLRKHYPDVEILVLFNGRTDEVAGADSCYSTEINLGFAGAINHLASKANRDYLLILNNDTVVGPGLLEELHNELMKPGVGIVGPYASQARPPQGDWLPGTHPGSMEVDSIVGLCMYVRRSTWFEVGGFCPSFMSSDDDDLCRRLKLRGYSIRIANTWIKHAGHKAFKSHNVNVDTLVASGLQKYSRKWPSVAVIAITKNERESLPKFVEQYRNVGIERFCILDSGSTDGTVEWARANGVEVKTAEFSNFADQRNRALAEFAYDQTKWVIMHDPDETLDKMTLNFLWELISSNAADIYHAPLCDSNGTEWVPKPFLFKASPHIRWVLPVHEKLIGSKEQVLITNAKITHQLEWHDAGRRGEMAAFYDKLGSDSEATEYDGYPIMNYKHREHPAIKKMALGPGVSVIIPTFNRGELLSKALRSVAQQDYIPFEIIVVGDNCEVAKGVVDSFLLSMPLRFYNLPANHGAGGAVPRNYGIMLADYDWIAYLDDDNQWMPNHISSLMLAIRSAGARAGLSSMQVQGKPIIFEQPAKGSVDTSCILHAKSLVYQYGWWKNRVEGGYWHDWSFVQPWLSERWAITKLPTVIYNKDTSGQREYLERLLADG